MKCRAAVLHGVGRAWSVAEFDGAYPAETGEVLVRWTRAACGAMRVGGTLRGLIVHEAA